MCGTGIYSDATTCTFVTASASESEGSRQTSTLSKLLKEARQLGCSTFDGTCDAIVAKNWLRKATTTLEDMGDDEMKLKVATRLLEKIAET